MAGRVSLLATVLFAVTAGQPPPAQAGEPVHASFSVSRTIGAAPLAVYFDSGETSHTDSSVDPFRDLTYRWTFGDRANGSGGTSTGSRWKISGADKNVSLGPQAAHVYDSPGQYTVSLTVKDRDGNHHAVQQMITVEDPNVVFAGDATACFSTSGNFAGCPPGATHQTTDDFDAALGFATSGSRLLFRRGESWISVVAGGVSPTRTQGSSCRPARRPRR